MRQVFLVFVVVLCRKHICSQSVSNTNETKYQHQIANTKQYNINFGSCRIVLNPQCPDPDVTFFMYTTAHPENPEPIYMAPNLRGTNLAKTSFDPRKPSKVIIHGYNSDMFLNALTELRKEYLKRNDYNIFTVDWSPLNQSPCYPGAVWNARHVGTCTAQLIDRIREMGSENIHAIGFSLGAHITNYVAIALRPYKLPRITGLDPALPGFITVGPDGKLDRTDANYVDVYHTNAFMQGKAEESGHVDFYFNGGFIQPGCWGQANFFSCNHHRAPLYYAESINSPKGFWGWACPSYIDYLFGRCPPNEVQILLGENMEQGATGTYMVVTSSAPPFAVGRFNTSFVISRVRPVKSASEMLEKYETEFLEPSVANVEDMYKKVMKERFENIDEIENEIFLNDFKAFDGDFSEKINEIEFV